MQSDPETPQGSALAPRSAQTALAEQDPTLTGGTGLFDHSARDAVSPGVGALAGIGALVLTAVIGAVLFGMNPSFASGKAFGTANQLGQPPAAAAGPELAPGSPAAEGAQIIGTKPCGGCHVIPGIPGANGAVGPSLAGVAGRNRIAGGAVPNSGPDDLRKWILDPPSLKPGTAMPKVPMTEDEATKIVAYLETLK